MIIIFVVAITTSPRLFGLLLRSRDHWQT